MSVKRVKVAFIREGDVGKTTLTKALVNELGDVKMTIGVVDISEPDTLYSLLNYPVILCHKILAWNKLDLGMKIREGEVQAIASHLKVDKVFYTSALRNYGVKELMKYMLTVVRSLA